MNAQNNINKEILRFITAQNDTVAVYTGDIKVINDLSFQVIDRSKLNKLKGVEIDKVYFVCDQREKSRVWLHGIFASSVPDGDLYILALNSKVHFIKNDIIQGSKQLVQKIKAPPLQ
ncbi:MAG: hypothetical protein DI539_22495 [Flavobacterium psychrophilum]|nr:MAG: hypothetical protein DI539_22495 [Flavobacterium psychrophilum]